MITGDTVQKRKRCLAKLVEEHLRSIGHAANIVENRENSEGHRDQVVVDSDIGVIHVTSTESLEPNASIPLAGYSDDSQKFLADKSFVAFGWNSKDKRTFLMFVDAKTIKDLLSLTKSEIKRMRDSDLSTVLNA